MTKAWSCQNNVVKGTLCENTLFCLHFSLHPTVRQVLGLGIICALLLGLRFRFWGFVFVCCCSGVQHGLLGVTSMSTVEAVLYPTWGDVGYWTASTVLMLVIPWCPWCAGQRLYLQWKYVKGMVVNEICCMEWAQTTLKPQIRETFSCTIMRDTGPLGLSANPVVEAVLLSITGPPWPLDLPHYCDYWEYMEICFKSCLPFKYIQFT